VVKTKWNAVWCIKIEQLLDKRASEGKELELTRSRVDELNKELKNSHEVVDQLSAQRDELQQSCCQYSDDLTALRMVSKCFQY